MKKQISITFFYLMAFTCLFGQSQITGKVNGNDQALFLATVVLHKQADSSFVQGATTDDLGQYELKNIEDGTYFLKASYIGFNDQFTSSITFPQANGQTLDFEMKEDVETLETVEVVGKVPLLEQRADRLVVNVENNIIGMNNSLIDVLKKIPGMIVVNNKVRMAGQSNITILLNGKPTEYMDVQSLLRDLPGDNVKKVEVIHQPGAEFDASGSGPVINIIFKKNSLFGTNGTFSAGLGKGTDWRYNSSVAMSHYKGPLNINGSVGYIRGGYVETLKINRNINGDIYDQNNVDPGRPSTFRSSLTMDYDIKDNQRIGFTSRYINSRTVKVAKNRTQIDFLSDNQNDLELLTTNASDRGWDFTYFNPYYTYKFDSTDHRIDFDINFARFTSKGLSTLTTEEFRVGERFPTQQYDQPGFTNILSSRLDYYRPLSKALKLQIGTKFSTADLDNELISTFQQPNGDWVNNKLQSNHYLFDETIYAAYSKLNFAQGKWSGTMGLRYENSVTNGKSVTLDSTFTRNISQLFPSFSLARQFDDIFGATVAYSYRIERPKYYSLNPFVYYWDPYTSDRGNPALSPSLTHSVRMNLTYEKEPFFTVEYKSSKDAMFEVTEQDDDTGEAYTTLVNLESVNNFNSSFYFPLDFIPGIEGYGGISANHISFESPYLDSRFLQSQWNFSAEMEFGFKLPGKINGQVTGWYDSGNQEGIFKSEWSYGVGVGFSRKFWDNKGRISVSAEDVFNRFWYARIDYSNMDINVIEQWDAPVVSMNFTYKFGNRYLNKNQRRKSSSSDEINRAHSD